MNTVTIPNEILMKETARLIAEGHTVTHVVRGNSMNPFLVDKRDKVVLAAVDAAQLRPGQMVLARESRGQIVLHRIISRNNQALVLMGDGNICGTEQTTVSDVIAVVTHFIRKGKTYDCSRKGWKILSAIWVSIKPARGIALAIWRRM